MNERVKGLLNDRLRTLGLQASSPSAKPADNHHKQESCFEIRATEGFSEHFIDLRFQNGNRVAFAYSELIYINFDAAESRLDLNFRGYMVSLSGQRLDGQLYDSLMDCRVRWVAEASAAQAPSPDVVHIQRIEIIVPGEAAETESAAGDVPP